jgi:mannose-6-phosphate isomerase-like protein (cupin superfamily)
MIKKVDLTALDQDALAQIRMEPDTSPSDIRDYSKLVVLKPWGYEYLIFNNDAVAVWILYLNNGAQTSMHCHPNKKTSLVVLEGQAICATLQERLPRRVGEGLLLDRGVFHQTTAISNDGAVVLEIETPLDKRNLVRLSDRYGREGCGYETADHFSNNLQNYDYLSLDQAYIDNNATKRFGECTLTLKGVTSADGLSDLRRLDDEDVISVLRGRLVDGQDRTVVETGDTVTIGDITAAAGTRLEVAEPVELLIIRRIDRQAAGGQVSVP